MNDVEAKNLATAHQYLAMLGDPSVDISEFADVLSEEVVLKEMPNRLSPDGSVRDMIDMMTGVRRGRGILSEQHYKVVSELVSGTRIAIEIEWTGTLAVSFGELQAGQNLKAYIATFLEFRDGKIISQQNYDCYEPFEA